MFRRLGLSILLSVGAFASSTPQAQRIAPVRKYSFAMVTHDKYVSQWGFFDSSLFRTIVDHTTRDTLYVTRSGVLFSIVDGKELDLVRAALAPIQKLRNQQNDVGRQQGQVGMSQARLGFEQADVGRQQAEIGRRLSQVVSEKGSDPALQTRMIQVSRRLHELQQKQKSLVQNQTALGMKQNEVGKKLSQATKRADDAISKIIDDAFNHGLAKKG